MRQPYLFCFVWNSNLTIFVRIATSVISEIDTHKRYWLIGDAVCSVLILVDSFICYSYTGCQSYDFIPVSVYILTFIPKIVVTPKSLS